MKNKILYYFILFLIFLIPFEIDFPYLGIKIPYLNTLLEILTFLVFLLFLGIKFSNKDFKIKKNQINLPIIIFLFWLVLASFKGIDFIWGLKYVFKFGGGVILYYIIYETFTKKNAILATKILVCAGVIVSIFGIIERFFPQNINNFLSIFTPTNFFLPEENTLRIHSTFVYPNLLSIYLEMIIFLTGAIFLFKKNNLYLISLLIIGESLIFTYSRGGIISLFCSLILTFCLGWYLNLSKNFVREWSKIIGIMLFLFGFTLFMDNVWVARAQSIFRPNYFANQERLYLWQSALQIIKTNPLTGVGPDCFRWVYAKNFLANAPFSSVSFTGGIPSATSNNLYLEIAANSGIIGLGLFLWFSVVIFRIFINTLKNKDEENKLLIGFFGVLICFYIHGLVDYFFDFQSIIHFFWVDIGLFSVFKK